MFLCSQGDASGPLGDEGAAGSRRLMFTIGPGRVLAGCGDHDKGGCVKSWNHPRTDSDLAALPRGHGPDRQLQILNRDSPDRRQTYIQTCGGETPGRGRSRSPADTAGLQVGSLGPRAEHHGTPPVQCRRGFLFGMPPDCQARVLLARARALCNRPGNPPYLTMSISAIVQA